MFSLVESIVINMSSLCFEAVLLYLLFKSIQLLSGECACRLSEENLVRNFTEISQMMTSVPEIIKAFSEFRGIKEDERKFFTKMLENKSLDENEKLAVELLIKVIERGGLMLCFLKKQLDVTEQQDLYKEISDSLM